MLQKRQTCAPEKTKNVERRGVAEREHITIGGGAPSENPSLRRGAGEKKKRKIE